VPNRRRTRAIIWRMRALARWLRIVSGMSLGLVLLAVSPAVFSDPSIEPMLEKVALFLCLLAFALLAAGWGLAARWDSAGMVLRGGGIVVFGLAMAVFAVAALPLPDWLGWSLFGLFTVAGLAFPFWLFVGGEGSASLVEPDAQGRLEVPVARAPTLMLAVLAGGMATLALALLRVPVFGWIAGPVGVLFFGGACVWLVLLAARPGPAIRADTEGMEDRSSLVGIRRMSWRESTRIREMATFGQPTVAVTPREWTSVVDRQAAWKRPLLKLNRRLIGSDDLLLNTSALPCSARELARALEEMRRDNC
jgi:hypothetical protein